ncbi:MAG: hypothetical protein A2785_01980 [Candidatus Chisholmbacteria bacterium RIFCSPHIGHO2_01_FULL_49_18]|uniref:(d)CMP kinase n=2 Tax=Candidatus Chisholmiibacteriota TaxID=1817900 RepID=A0A1G1VNP9_9BACT|nr:MAG: hypothetical protein A2785_01980 [Candidatus Chisholmbacteria bacterium RIFCSPHIGHO2_01_FULL_49_18]OGY21146.1 MAG: hypothetical protein A3A65_03620 [Candidatus Chisholmbacteria bacterium RIFCSPLOWO2_01_FULL_49_14]
MRKLVGYRNITISGLPGAGSTTLGKSLSAVIGWKFFSAGEFMREYAIKKGIIDGVRKLHHDATIYDEKLDRQVDFGMRQALKTKTGQIFESFLSGFMAQGIAGTLKILIYCSVDSVRVDRIVNRDNVSVREAKDHIFAREQKNANKWRKIYKREWQEWVVTEGIVDKTKPIWFWYPNLYDLTIDTYKNSKEETLKLALRALGAEKLEIKDREAVTPK